LESLCGVGVGVSMLQHRAHLSHAEKPSLLKNTNMNKTVKKKVNFINSSQNEGLYPSWIAPSFDGFGSISWHSIFFSALLQFSQWISDFQFFRPKYH
jgi:hypothetical protein